MPRLDNTVNRLTGIRPTGRMHLGHYFSVIKPALELEATVLVAEYHAPQSEIRDVENMIRTLRDFGVRDIKLQSEDFQTDVYFELLSVARIGELQRMTQFMTGGDDNDAHLLVYPVLMTHDIMGYDEICVGEDQAQHINYARDLIHRYNATFKTSVRLPLPRIVGGRVMSLSDPDKKMSKSEPNGCLFLDDKAHDIERKIKAAVMTEDGKANLIELYRNLGGKADIPNMNSEFKSMVTTQVLVALNLVEIAL